MSLDCIIEEIRKIVVDSGYDFEGIQESLSEDVLPEIIYKTKLSPVFFTLPFNPKHVIASEILEGLNFHGKKKRKKRMTLREKLHSIYAEIDHIEKKGFNKHQSYHFMRAADVTNALRRSLIAQKVYAEINFHFTDPPYTIARAKEKDAPYSAVNVQCSIIFRDLESEEISKASGLGTGADVGDKAVYKAQTGALKYALKNAFLVPDEADPESDESIDQGTESQEQYEEPSFQQASRTSRPAVAATLDEGNSTRGPVKTKQVEIPLEQAGSVTVAAGSPADVPLGAAKPEREPAKPEREPGDDSDVILPSEEELNGFRAKFKLLGDDLSDKGKLKASKGLPINIKLKVFLLHITKADEPKNITRQQWIDFFERVDSAVARENGLVDLGKLINKINGIEK